VTMPNEKIKQIDNVVGGDLAGRDIYKVSNYAIDPSRPTSMAKMIEKFKEEIKNNKVIDKIIDDLQHYSNPAPGDTLIGLEAKMEEGGRSDMIPFAKRTKELYYKKLTQYQFSETAQEIHVFLLAEVFTRFHNFIHPLMGSNLSQIQINEIIQDKIINPIQDILDENVLRLYSAEINGMLYFLTGNCHIRWIK